MLPLVTSSVLSSLMATAHPPQRQTALPQPSTSSPTLTCLHAQATVSDLLDLRGIPKVGCS